MYSAYVSQEPFMNPWSSTLSSYPSDLSRQKPVYLRGLAFLEEENVKAQLKL